MLRELVTHCSLKTRNTYNFRERNCRLIYPVVKMLEVVVLVLEINFKFTVNNYSFLIDLISDLFAYKFTSHRQYLTEPNALKLQYTHEHNIKSHQIMINPKSSNVFQMNNYTDRLKTVILAGKSAG